MIELSSPLGQFLASYFHPDWYLDDDSSESVVDQFVQVSDTNHVAEVSQQLDSFIRETQSLSTDEIERELLVIGAYYRCQAENRTVREWLRVLSDRLGKT